MSLILNVLDLTRYWGETCLFENVSFSINEGERVALIAKNGTGTTTMLNIIAGIDSSDSGNVELFPGTILGYLKQNPEFENRLTVSDAIFQANAGIPALIKRYEEALISENADTISKVMEEMDRHKAWDFEHRVKEILEKLRIPDLQKEISTMSGGQKKRLALA